MLLSLMWPFGQPYEHPMQLFHNGSFGIDYNVQPLFLTRPMAECASRIIEENGYQDRIKLVRKRSTELNVGPGCDMEERANILVTEVSGSA